jgi:hypothetical protein
MRQRNNEKAVYQYIFQQEGRIGDPCVYCNDVSSTLDHVPPLHYVARMRQMNQKVTNAKLVPACAECNSILNGKLYLTISKRKAHIYERLKAKNRKILRIPEWSEEELSEISPELARSFRAATVAVHNLRARLFWLRGGR